MFRIRHSSRADFDQVFAVAEHLDTMNLPAEPEAIAKILQVSEASFAEQLPVSEREYLFVLEDMATGKVIGTSMIYAQHGTKRAPHIFFRVEADERYSYTLDSYFVHQTLRIGYNYDGPTEIGGLILLPEYRRNTQQLGKFLSFVRFLYIAMHRSWFRDRVLSELLPPLGDDGSSKLWDHIGRHFTGLTYQQADRISKDNKEFINALFPDDPIHTALLPEEVRNMIGTVGEESKGVEKMLRRIGFEYAGQIDPFDGGPHFSAATSDITVVEQAASVIVHQLDIAAPDGTPDGTGEAWLLGFEPGPGQFCALVARGIATEDGCLGLSASTLAALGATPGATIWRTSFA